jgi:hypothetical protein
MAEIANPTSLPRIIVATHTDDRGVSQLIANASEIAFHIPGNAPLTARHTVNIVMRILSAIGSIIVPTTVLRFHLLAIQPSTKSDRPAYASKPTAQVFASCSMRYPMTGLAAILVTVRKFGIVYMSSWTDGVDLGFSANSLSVLLLAWWLRRSITRDLYGTAELRAKNWHVS